MERAAAPLCRLRGGALRRRLYDGEQQLEAGTARRLMCEIDQLRDELAGARRTFATKAAAALEERLKDVAAGRWRSAPRTWPHSFNRGGCPQCHEAEARAFLGKLQRIASQSADQGGNRTTEAFFTAITAGGARFAGAVS